MKRFGRNDEYIFGAATANCDACKRGAHIACTKRANDEGVWGSCWCAEVEHRARRQPDEDWKRDYR